MVTLANIEFFLQRHSLGRRHRRGITKRAHERSLRQGGIIYHGDTEAVFGDPGLASMFLSEFSCGIPELTLAHVMLATKSAALNGFYGVNLYTLPKLTPASCPMTDPSVTPPYLDGVDHEPYRRYFS